jgi:hypothetical protein
MVTYKNWMRTTKNSMSVSPAIISKLTEIGEQKRERGLESKMGIRKEV